MSYEIVKNIRVIPNPENKSEFLMVCKSASNNVRPYCVESCTDSLGQRLDVFDTVYVKSDKHKTKYEIIESTFDHEGNTVFIVRECQGRTTAQYYPEDLVRIK